jgi:hypothetical protein
MEAGKFIRKAFNIYLDNPIIIVPFLLFGILSTTTNLWLENYITAMLPVFENPAELLMVSMSGSLHSAFSRIIVVAILLAIVVSLISSYIEAYSIGLARSMSTKKGTGFKEGVPALKKGLTIFGVKLIVITLIMAVAIGATIPLVILFKLVGILASFVVVLIFGVSLVVITFFASQSIVLENKNVWGGIRGSYKLLRNNIEEVAILLLFMLFSFVILTVLQEVGVALAETFISEYLIALIRSGLHLLLFSMILSPYFIILKTYFYFKRSREA